MPPKYLQEQNSRTRLYAYKESKTWPQYLAAGLATLGATAMGMHLAWSSSAIAMLQLPTSDPRITDEQGSWIGSLLTLGGLAGALPSGFLTNCLGRKRTLQLLALPLLVAWFIIAFSGSVWGYYIARVLAGLSAGVMCVVAPMYVGELAEAKIRGTLGTFFQLQITVGLLLGYILGGSVDNFQLLALISAIPPVIFLLTFSFMPESPVFYCSKRQINEARKSLQWLRGKDYDIEDELAGIQDSIKEAGSSDASLLDMVKCKATSRAMIISLALMFFQQLSGINAVLFYAANIFRDTGSTMSPNIAAVIIGAVQVVATYVSSVLIDRAGRRILLIISGSIMALCLGVLSLYFYLQQVQDMLPYSYIPLASLAIYIIVFSIGFGPIPWVMMGEIFPSHIKGVASSVSVGFNWALAFAVTKLFQNMVSAFGTATTFSLFSCISALGALFVILRIPETKGRSIQEVQRLLLGEKLSKCGSDHTFINADEVIKIEVKK